MHRDTQPYATEHHDIASHPDVAEMDQRYARVLHNPRVSVVDGLIMLTGLYVAISPWVVHFQNNNTIMRNVDLILGLALAVIGFGMSTRPERLLQAGWAVSLIGVFLIISPWVAGAGHNAAYPVIYNNAFAGGSAVRPRASRYGHAALWTFEATRPCDRATRGESVGTRS